MQAAMNMNKEKNPVIAKMAELITPALESVKVGVSVVRSGFNLFTRRDPFLTFLFQVATILMMLLLIVFPWRLFFFVIGFGLVGPQNFFARIMLEKKKLMKTESDATPMDNYLSKTKKNPNFSRSTASGVEFAVNTNGHKDGEFFRFHNHLLTNGGIDLIAEKKKSSGKVYRAVVPNSPLQSRRFYDWPPNPSLSRIQARLSGVRLLLIIVPIELWKKK